MRWKRRGSLLLRGGRWRDLQLHTGASAESASSIPGSLPQFLEAPRNMAGPWKQQMQTIFLGVTLKITASLLLEIAEHYRRMWVHLPPVVAKALLQVGWKRLWYPCAMDGEHSLQRSHGDVLGSHILWAWVSHSQEPRCLWPLQGQADSPKTSAPCPDQNIRKIYI